MKAKRDNSSKTSRDSQQVTLSQLENCVVVFREGNKEERFIEELEEEPHLP